MDRTRKLPLVLQHDDEADKLDAEYTHNIKSETLKGKKMKQNQAYEQPQQQHEHEQEGRIPIILIGHSLGAYVVYELTRHVNNPNATSLTSSSSGKNKIVIDKLILVSPAAATRPVDFSRALYFSLPPQAIVRRGGLLGFLLFSMKYPRSAAYMRDHLREFTYRLAMQSPASGESAIRPIIRFTGWNTAECVRPLSELVIMDSSNSSNRIVTTTSTSADANDSNNGKNNDSTVNNNNNSSSDDDGKLRRKISPSTTTTTKTMMMTTTKAVVGVPKAYEKTKTLIIAGDSDSSMPVQGVIDLYRMMKSRNFDVSLSVFDQCDHCPQLEQPLRFADTVSDFLCAPPSGY